MEVSSETPDWVSKCRGLILFNEKVAEPCPEVSAGKCHEEKEKSYVKLQQAKIELKGEYPSNSSSNEVKQLSVR